MGENCTGVGVLKNVYLYGIYRDFNKNISMLVIHRISKMHLEREKGFGHCLYKMCKWHVCLLLISHYSYEREREREREREGERFVIRTDGLNK